MSSGPLSVWLPRVIFESVLITVSILLALALDEWRETRQDLQTVEQALANFLSEIRQNKARVDDAAPFNKGLRSVLEQRYQEGNVGTSSDFISIIESYTPVVLQSTAWDTALATGSVTKMDYSLVSALSLTYGLQSRYQEATRDSVLDLANPQNLSPERLELSVYNSIRYLDGITSMETELSVVYTEAETVIRDAWMSMRGAGSEQYQAWTSAL